MGVECRLLKTYIVDIIMTPKQGLLVCCLGILLWGSASAERDWYKYENAHFEAFSDETPRAVQRVLKELELFRAAVIQVANIRIPDGAPKVRVVMFASNTQFHTLIGSIRISGAATMVDGTHYIVFADKGNPAWEERTARYEYAHVLLRYKNFPYPRWFNEGFAELMSTTEFRNRNREFSVGKPTDRRISTTLLTPWEDLLAHDFDLHGIKDYRRRSDAYLLSWVLTYHFMIDDDFTNSDKLVHYLTLLGQGQDSVGAFEAAVGEPADEYCNKLLREYTKRKLKFVTYVFSPEFLDLDFVRSDALVEDIKPLLDKLEGGRAEN
jgi:hypothetical protein